MLGYLLLNLGLPLNQAILEYQSLQVLPLTYPETIPEDTLPIANTPLVIFLAGTHRTSLFLFKVSK